MNYSLPQATLDVTDSCSRAPQARPDHCNLNPSLVNLNPDPMFTEKVSYNIPCGVTTIGRDDSNDIVLPSPSISPRHCVISYEARTGLLMLTNFEGSETYVNGRRILPLPLGYKEGFKGILYQHHDDRNTTVTLRHSFRICFGSNHVFRMNFAATEEEEKHVSPDYEFATEEMRLVRGGGTRRIEEEEIKDQEDAAGGGGGCGGYGGYVDEEGEDARTRVSVPDEPVQLQSQAACVVDELPQEFEAMFNNMTPPSQTLRRESHAEIPQGELPAGPESAKSSGTSSTVDNSACNANPDAMGGGSRGGVEGLLMNSIASKLDGFASQLTNISEDDKKIQRTLTKLPLTNSKKARDIASHRPTPPSGLQPGKHQMPNHDSPFSIYGYNPTAINSAHCASGDVSQTASEAEFLEYERALMEERLSPHSDSTAQTENTVVLNVNGEEIQVKKEEGKDRAELSESFAAKSRAALEELRKEIEDEEGIDEFDLAIEEVIMSDPVNSQVSQGAAVSKAELPDTRREGTIDRRREEARMRLRSRQKSIMRSGSNP